MQDDHAGEDGENEDSHLPSTSIQEELDDEGENFDESSELIGNRRDGSRVVLKDPSWFAQFFAFYRARFTQKRKEKKFCKSTFAF